MRCAYQDKLRQGEVDLFMPLFLLMLSETDLGAAWLSRSAALRVSLSMKVTLVSACK